MCMCMDNEQMNEHTRTRAHAHLISENEMENMVCMPLVAATGYIIVA